MNISTDSQKIDELLTRGVAEVIDIKNLRQKLESGTQLRVKLGIDPTSPNIHIGRSIPLLKLRDFQELGHQIIFIAGDFTGVVGDTSDKDAERPMLTRETIEKNLETYREQVGKILDLDRVEFRYNSEWLGKLTYAEIGEHADVFSINDFINRELIKKRLDNGTRVSLREVLYPLMQGYDSVAVHADVELGGTDQKFNLLAGRDLQRKYNQEPQDIVMNQLIAGTDGRKMSSSWGNTINLLDIAPDMFTAVMRVHDDLIVEYFTLVTRVPMDTVQDIAQRLSGREHPRDIKIELAREIVRMYHGESVVAVAEKYWREAFQQGGVPDEIPCESMQESELLVDTFMRAGVVSSKSDFARLVDEGAISKFLNGDFAVISDKKQSAQPGKYKIGKKRFLEIV